ncbi:MAG: tagaturonate epimerase family protein [Planctomycetota bacterium]|nr:tagaturonate epimerase family protein [Planctomycetota bacterium]
MSSYTATIPTTLGLAPSFGFGDRFGLATPGHAASLRRCGAGILPMFAQQSIREMGRTNRSPQQVMADAQEGVRRAGYTGKQGADADHLKTPQDVDRTAEAGFCFFTIDPSGDVDAGADDYNADQLAEKFKVVAGEVSWLAQYENKKIALSTGTTIDFTPAVVRRAAVKYGRAINMATKLAAHIASVNKRLNRDHEIELSVDETPRPTTLAEHYIIAEQCLRAGMKLVSLAPRFIGEFEKGIDYIGNVAALEKSLNDHAAIAKQLGPYKLSLHSGSDKLSIYPSLARSTKGLFHVKTAGTSYLEALRVLARVNVPLFREVITLSRSRYDTDRATYHVSATLKSAAPAEQISDARALEKAYLGLWADAKPMTGLSDPGRQILHCTFGSVLCDPKLGPQVKAAVKENQTLYTQLLDEHFGKHLEALKAGL